MINTAAHVEVILFLIKRQIKFQERTFGSRIMTDRQQVLKHLVVV